MKLLITVLIMIFFSSCNNQQDVYKNEMIGIHHIDIQFTEPDFLECIGTDDIYIDLKEDDSFIIKTSPKTSLDGVRGEWSVNSDIESLYHEFSVEGGYSHTTQTIGVVVECDSQSGILEFKY